MATMGPHHPQPQPAARHAGSEGAGTISIHQQGQILSGILISIEPVTVKEKPAMEYMFRDEKGGRVTCLGTNDLDKKLQPVHIGH